jgi:putative copper export protein
MACRAAPAPAVALGLLMIVSLAALGGLLIAGGAAALNTMRAARRYCVQVAPDAECGGWLGARLLSGALVTCDVPAFAAGVEQTWSGATECAAPAVEALLVVDGLRAVTVSTASAVTTTVYGAMLVALALTLLLVLGGKWLAQHADELPWCACCRRTQYLTTP